MAKPIIVEGETVLVPDDATPEEMMQIANQHAGITTPPAKQQMQPSDLFKPENKQLLENARAANVAAIPGQIYGLGYGAANTVLGGAGELENLVRKTVPEFLGAKPLYNASNVFGDKSETFFPTMAQVKETATSLGVPAPTQTSAETVGEFLPLVKPTASLVAAVSPKVISGAKKIASPLTNLLENYKAAKTAEPIVEDIKTVLGPQALEASKIAEMQTAQEADKAKRIALALRGVQKGTGEPVPPGKIALPTEIGTESQAAATSRLREIEQTQKTLDKEYRNARNDVIKELESQGKAPEKTKAYKELVAQLKPVVQYKLDPAKSPSILKEPSEPVQKLYQKIWDAVVSKKIELSPQEAKKAEKLGYEVQVIKKGKEEPRYFRKFSQSFDAFDDTRRFLGKVFSGNPPEGYEAISGVEKERLYDLFKRIQNEYAGSAQRDLQKNWADAENKLDLFETKAGKILTATQGETGAMRTTAAEVPNKFFGKGQGKFQEYLDFTNPRMAVQHAESWLRSQLEGKSAAEVKKILSNPKSQINDMLQHPALREVKNAADSYYGQLIASENRAKRLGGALKDYESATKAKSAATETRQEIDARAKLYDTLKPEVFIKKIFAEDGALIQDLKAGRISQQQYDDLSAQAQNAVRLFGKTETAKNKIKTILTVGGVLGVGSGVIGLSKKAISE